MNSTVETTTDSGLSWMAFRTRVRAEKLVARIIAGRGIETYVPVREERRRWSDRWKVVETPVFNCYVFARPPRDSWHRLLEIGHVWCVVRDGDAPALIAQHEIDNLRRFVGALGDAEPEVAIELPAVGELVTIARGPFAGIAGRVTSHRGGYRLSVSIEAAALTASVVIDAVDLDTLVNAPAA